MYLSFFTVPALEFLNMKNVILKMFLIIFLKSKLLSRSGELFLKYCDKTYIGINNYKYHILKEIKFRATCNVWEENIPTLYLLSQSNFINSMIILFIEAKEGSSKIQNSEKSWNIEKLQKWRKWQPQSQRLRSINWSRRLHANSHSKIWKKFCDIL